MSPSTRRRIRSIAAWCLGAAAVGGLWSGARKLFSVDPFAAFRPTGQVDSGFQLGAFQLRSYVGDRLVAYAAVDSAVGRRDRSLFDLVNLHDGKLTTSAGDVFNFEAHTATYGTFNKSIVADSGGRIWNDRLDLNLPKFSYDGQGRVLRVEGPVSGKLDGGDLTAEGVYLDVQRGELLVKTFVWQGQAQVQGQQRKTWQVKGDNSRLNNDTWTADHGRAESEDTIVYGDKLSLDRKADVMTVTGNVRYFGTDANLTCDKVVIYRKEHRSVLSGNVHMLVKPEEDSKVAEVPIPPLAPVVPDSIAKDRPPAPPSDQTKSQEDAVRDRENLRKYPATVIADQIEYWYQKGERHAIITGDPQARQELPGGHWRMVWAFKALYDGEKDRLKMLSREGKKDARLKDSLGDDLVSIDVEVSTKKGDDFMEATEPEGALTVREDDLPEKPGTGSGGGKGSTGGGQPTISGPIGGRRRS